MPFLFAVETLCISKSTRRCFVFPSTAMTFLDSANLLLFGVDSVYSAGGHQLSCSNPPRALTLVPSLKLVWWLSGTSALARPAVFIECCRYWYHIPVDLKACPLESHQNYSVRSVCVIWPHVPLLLRLAISAVKFKPLHDFARLRWVVFFELFNNLFELCLCWFLRLE